MVQSGWLGVVAFLVVVGLILYVVISGWGSSAQPGGSDALDSRPVVPVAWTLKVVRSEPHAVDAFTQGLVFDGDELFESTGHVGESTLRVFDADSLKEKRRVDIPRPYFAEGIAVVGESVIVLTWQSGKALVYDKKSLKKKDAFFYEGEGWGLCFDGQRLVRSDGSDKLSFHSPKDFTQLGSVSVHKAGRPLFRINELECVGKKVLANVWQRDEIVEIDPQSGAVTATLDASALLDEAERREANVLNGIAYRAKNKHFFLTGKYWPRIFEVKIEKQAH